VRSTAVPRSPFFLRIRAQVLQLTKAVPKGRVCTYASMGAHLDVMPRHVAYVLSQLEDDEKLRYLWHRVVAGDGSLGVPKTAPDGTTQAELLRAEGIRVTDNAIASGFDRSFIDAADLPSGLPKQVRPADAPVAKTTRAPRRRRQT
jgi:methylated-DNA-protein-cysteine methyltransferase-like protein